MRILIIMWAIPVVFFWGWYGLSYFDINFGIAFLTRRTHDIVFYIYGNMLNMPPSEVPMALVKIFAFDSLLVFAIAAWRWREGWYPQTKQWVVGKYQYICGWVSNINQDRVSDPVHPAE